MPLYEYECAECHRRTEKIQKFSDPEITTCPFCGGALARTITAPAIQFKGSGWYKDLYSSAKPTPPAGSGEGASANAGGSGEGSGKAETSSKPEASPAAAPSGPSTPAPSSSGASTS